MTDMGKVLKVLVKKIKELSPQLHLEFQTETHEINYFCNAVAEFSKTLLGLMDNSSSERYTFIRSVSAIFAPNQEWP